MGVAHCRATLPRAITPPGSDRAIPIGTRCGREPGHLFDHVVLDGDFFVEWVDETTRYCGKGLSPSIAEAQKRARDAFITPGRSSLKRLISLSEFDLGSERAEAKVQEGIREVLNGMSDERIHYASPGYMLVEIALRVELTGYHFPDTVEDTIANREFFQGAVERHDDHSGTGFDLTFPTQTTEEATHG